MSQPVTPKRILWLVNLFGANETLRLLELRAGTVVYFPRRPEKSWFEKQFGFEIAEKVSRAHGGETIELPLAKRWRAEMYRHQGLTHEDIAIKLGVGMRSVRRYLLDAGLTDTNNSLDTTDRRAPKPMRDDPALSETIEEVRR